jgi:hypothetical protein
MKGNCFIDIDGIYENDGSKVGHNIKHLWVIMWHVFTSTNNTTTILFPHTIMGNTTTTAQVQLR